MFTIGLTDHLEGPPERPSAEIFDEVADLVQLADRLGVRYAWFTEHHAHVHHGHLPTPLLFALHMAGRTREIQLGTAVICLNQHHPVDVAEQVAVADLLMGGRLAVGFGSGSTAEEARLFGIAEANEEDRHHSFANALKVICAFWRGEWRSQSTRYFLEPPYRPLPLPPRDLKGRCWIAVNSVGAARIAGTLNFNVLFSHLRTPEQNRTYTETYRAAGGTGLVAVNRPVFVGPDDASALELSMPAMRLLWNRFRREGKIEADLSEPTSLADLCAHPINFIVGGPETVALQFQLLHEYIPFDVANVEVRWAGMSHESVLGSLRRLTEDVMPKLG